MGTNQAISSPSMAGEEDIKRVVTSLYQALATLDVETVHSLLATQLEWWFHGPPVHQHLMHLLTGRRRLSSDPSTDNRSSFTFKPLSIVAFAPVVVVEGFNKEWNVSWVHAWAISTRGIVTQIREYFNTSVIVTRFGDGCSPSSAPLQSVSSKSCQRVWQSELCDHDSVPGLVLAL